MSRAAQCVAVLAWAMMGLAAHSAVSAAPDDVPSLELYPGMSLQSVLAALNANGYRVVYSSALVLADMRLREAPRATHIDDLLREILAPWNLAAINAGNGDRLIVKAKEGGAPQGAPRAASPHALETIDVTASRYGLAMDTGAGTGTAVFLDRNDLQRIPHLADDAVRVLKLLPGVTGGDYSAALNIRGGRRDETLLMIDGAEIHNGFHFRDLDGALSVLDTHLVQSIDFITGGMTAEYGDYMSGVVDLRTRRPAADDEYRSALGISFVSAYGRTGGTFAQESGSWLIAARRGYLDLVLEQVQPDDEQLTPRYNDLFASVAYDFDEDTSLSARLLLGDDDLKLISTGDDEVDSAGGGRAAHFWITLDHGWNDTWRTRSVLSAASVEQTRDARGVDDERSGDVISDFDFRFLDFRQDWSWTGSPDHLPRFGYSASRHEASYDYRLVASIIDPTTPDGIIDLRRETNLDVSGTKIGAYASWRSRLTDVLTAEAGARWDSFRYPNGVSFEEVSPRFNVVYTVGTQGELRAAWGIAHQPHGIDELQVEDGVTEFVGPERAIHSVISYTHRFTHGISARMDVYRKEYENQRVRFENALDPIELIPEGAIDRIAIYAPTAEAQGIELTVRRKAELGFAGWASAAFAKARDKEFGTWVPRSWEQELTFSFGASWTGALWSLNFAGLYHNGTPTTALRTALVPTSGGLVPVIVPEQRNAARLGAYARVDLRVNRDVPIRAGKFSYYLEVMNLLDRRNPCCIEKLAINSRNSALVNMEEGYWMPRLPSLGFQWEF